LSHEIIDSFTRASVSSAAAVPFLLRFQIRTLLRRITATALILIALTIAANARPAVGSIDFGGVVSFDTLSLATATTVNTWNSSFVLQGSGDFSSIAPGTNVTMGAPWIFDSGTPSTPSLGPAKPTLWSVSGFTFDLTSSLILGQNANFLNVTGPGTISGMGFDATPGVWTFTSSNSSGSDNSTFSFQANTSAVPEAGTVWLLATGALALAGMRFLRRQSQKKTNTANSYGSTKRVRP
jgi:hypothetical protein